MRKLIVALGLTAAVSACGREAGHEVDAGTFGNATLNNVQTLNGERSYAKVLAERFAREVPNQVNFAFDSAQLDPAAQQTLRQQADWIKQFPEVRFRVYGHTDLVGSDAYNEALGLRRELHAKDPTSRQARRDLFVVLSNLGARTGDTALLEEALTLARAALRAEQEPASEGQPDGGSVDRVDYRHGARA